MFGIFGADDTQFFRHLPIDSQIRVVQQQSAIRFRMIEVIAFVGEDGLVAEHRETMCKALGDEELTLVILTQLHAVPLTEGGTVFAQIDSHIQDTADGAAHQFSLGVRRTLEMQTAHYTVTGTRLVVLNELRVNARFAVTLLVVRLHKIPARIFVHLGFNHQQSLKRSFNYIHILYFKKYAKVLLFFYICK